MTKCSVILSVFLGLLDLNINKDGLHFKYHLIDGKQISFTVIKIDSKHCKLDDRSFTCVAPKLWNALSFEFTDVKSFDTFKIKLKPYRLFSIIIIHFDLYFVTWVT